jgi:hypothetical protein
MQTLERALAVVHVTREGDDKQLRCTHGAAGPQRQARIITGGTTGIDTRLPLLASGVKVFICGRTPEHLKDALRGSGKAVRGR